MNILLGVSHIFSVEKIKLWIDHDQTGYDLIKWFLGYGSGISAGLLCLLPRQENQWREKDVSRMNVMRPFHHTLFAILLENCDSLTESHLHIFTMFSPPLLARIVTTITAKIYFMLLLYQAPFCFACVNSFHLHSKYLSLVLLLISF